MIRCICDDDISPLKSFDEYIFYSQIYKKWLNSVASWLQKRSIHVAHQYLEMYRIQWLVTQLFNINHLML